MTIYNDMVLLQQVSRCGFASVAGGPVWGEVGMPTLAVNNKAEGSARESGGAVKDAKAPEGVGPGVPNTSDDGTSPASPSETYLLQVEFRTGSEDTGDRDFITITKTTTTKELCGYV